MSRTFRSVNHAFRVSGVLGGAALGSLPSTRALAANDEVKSFALVVTNNQSSTLEVPDLQYADDDGARYYKLFQSVGDPAGVALLTRFDRASTALYPDVLGAVRVPTRPEVETAVAKIALAVTAARARGDRTVFYFVYAGHGHVDNGRGYIDLEDTRVDGDFIERAILEKIPASEKHVVLDSCNSFFVLNPRKPGGRRWSTPTDMALGFARRHPEVGLFLSTNSDTEVYEWSELESGVFSHEVRSGLSGAADADGDGVVSYAELAGFVDKANAHISRESLRPHLYYRGPNGDPSSTLFSPLQTKGRRLVLGDGVQRLWVKSETGERLLDLHKEREPMTVVLPGSPTQAATIYVERKPGAAGGKPTVLEHDAPAGESDLRLADLSAQPVTTAARGDRLFGTLFALPYGRAAYRDYVAAASSEQEPVYGIASADITRMHNYLEAMASMDRRQRHLAGGFLLGAGTIMGSIAAASFFDSEKEGWTAGERTVFGGIGAAYLAGGAYFLATRGAGELALEAFERELGAGANQPAAFVRTEAALEDMARRDRRRREFAFWLWEGLGVGMAAVTTTFLLKPSMLEEPLQPSAATALYTTAGGLIVGGLLLRTLETPTERLLKLYRDDPSLKLHLDVVPTASGVQFGISGAF